MDAHVLTDPNVFPSDEVLAHHLGPAKAAFNGLFVLGNEVCPGMEAKWKFYNDGKSWLLSASRKKKTLFWLAVYAGGFRVSFYLSDKAEAAVEASAIPEACKETWRQTAGKKFRAVTLPIRTDADLAGVGEMIKVKMGG